MINFFFNPKTTVKLAGYLAIACVISLIPISFTVGLLIALTIVGIPILFLKPYIVGISVFIIVTHIFFHLLRPLKGLVRWICAAFLTTCVFGILPYMENQRLSNIAEELVADDLYELKHSTEIDTLALNVSGDNGLCSQFCLRILLNGEVSKVVVPHQHLQVNFEPEDTAGTIYWLEKRDTCEAVNQKINLVGLDIDKKHIENEVLFPEEFLRLKASQGVCLQYAESKLSAADAILSNARLSFPENNSWTGFRISVNTVEARRITFSVRKQHDEFRTVYQSTGVRVKKLFPILMPGILGFKNNVLKWRFIRWVSIYGDMNPNYFKPYANRAKFKYYSRAFVDDLGFKLSIPQGDVETVTREIVQEAIDQSGDIDQATAKVVVDFYKKSVRDKMKTKENAFLLSRIFLDERIDLFSNQRGSIRSYSIRKVMRNIPDEIDKFAEELFERLRRINISNFEGQPESYARKIRQLSVASALIPDDTMLQYKNDVYRIARDNKANSFAIVLLDRLYLYGSDAIPLMFHLIDADEKPKSLDGVPIQESARRHIALRGICKLGTAASTVTSELIERAYSGVINYNELGPLTKTLLNLGVSESEIWELWLGLRKTPDRRRFGRIVEKYKANRGC